MIIIIMFLVIVSVTILMLLALTKKLTKTIFTLFVLFYILFMVYILYFPRQFADYSSQEVLYKSVQLKPFSSIENSIHMAQISKSYFLLIWNWAGNLFLLMPIAISIGYYSKSLKLFPTVFLGFFISAVIELSQLAINIYFYRYSNKVVDVDDIIINGVGFMMCYAVVYYLKKKDVRK